MFDLIVRDIFSSHLSFLVEDMTYGYGHGHRKNGKNLNKECILISDINILRFHIIFHRCIVINIISNIFFTVVV